MIRLINSWTLKRQLSVVFLTGILMLAGVLSISILTVVSNEIEDHTRTQWKTTAESLVDLSKLALTIDSKETAADTINRIITDPNVLKAGIYYRDGTTLAEQGGVDECHIGSVTEQSTKQLFDQHQETAWCFVFSIRLMLDDEPSEWDLTRKLTKENNLLGFVRVWVTKSSINSLITKIIIINVAIAFTITVGIFFLVQYLANRITGPIESLSTTMDRAEKGENGLRAEITGPADVVRMETAFNKMMTVIELKEQSLESEVQARTQNLATAYHSALSAARYKSQLLATVSHEMRAPLHGVTGYLQLVLEQPAFIKNNDQINEWLIKALQCSCDLSRQINQILDYSRIESGKMELSISEFQVKDIIDAAVDIVMPLTKRNNNVLTISAISPLKIRSDKDKLSQIILNLLTNANKFTENGAIELNSVVFTNLLRVTVSDSGCGIPKDKLENIFEPFWQVDMSDTRKYGGTGLGLAVSKHFAKLLGGRIEVRSKLGYGSKFSLSIPINTDPNS